MVGDNRVDLDTRDNEDRSLEHYWSTIFRTKPELQNILQEARGRRGGHGQHKIETGKKEEQNGVQPTIERKGENHDITHTLNRKIKEMEEFIQVNGRLDEMIEDKSTTMDHLHAKIETLADQQTSRLVELSNIDGAIKELEDKKSRVFKEWEDSNMNSIKLQEEKNNLQNGLDRLEAAKQTSSELSGEIEKLEKLVAAGALNSPRSEYTELDELLLQQLELSPDPAPEWVVPKERARPLDQGMAETCTIHALANAIADGLHDQSIDINLFEVVGALKQDPDLNLDEGNRVEDFEDTVLRNMMDKKTKVSGDITLEIKRITNDNKHLFKTTKIVLVYYRDECDPSTMHCVFVKTCKRVDSETRYECINSWGDDPTIATPSVPVNRRGNMLYSVRAIWQCKSQLNLNSTSTGPQLLINRVQ
jgi:hypothetical protein